MHGQLGEGEGKGGLACMSCVYRIHPTSIAGLSYLSHCLAPRKKELLVTRQTLLPVLIDSTVCDMHVLSGKAEPGVQVRAARPFVGKYCKNKANGASIDREADFPSVSGPHQRDGYCTQ